MSQENNKKISRRKFLIDTGLVAGGAALGTTLLASCAAKTTTETVTKNITVTSPPVTVTATSAPKPISIEVYEPTGAGAMAITNMFAPRLTTLDGKTIALMACDASKWQTFRILPYVSALIQKKYPTAKFVPMTEFTQGLGVDSEADAKKAIDKGANAMIDAFAA
jgi:hypothetical protein